MNEELLYEYMDSLQKRIERIDSLLGKLAEGNNRAGENVRLLAHSLHGSGATFGFPEISAAGRAAEHAESADLLEAAKNLKAVLERVVADNPVAKPPAPEEPEAPEAPDQAPARKDSSPQHAPAPPAAETPDESKGSKILVVEDEQEMASFIKGILGSVSNYEVTVVDTGAKAQEAVVRGSFDLIIMDLVLPDRDGRELIREIKLEFHIKSPVLVLSSIENDSVRVECMSLGADKFLNKPFYEDDLLGEVKNLLGKQARKKLTLVPLEGDAPAADEDEEDSGPGPLDGKSILVADDDPSEANLIKQRLIAEGAAVKHAGNGREAMQLLRMQEFSLLILDVKMPVMDGFEVLQRVRGDLKLELPVIMVTAMGSEQDIIRGYDLGATDYILKPFSEVLLVARVKSLLKRTTA